MELERLRRFIAAVDWQSFHCVTERVGIAQNSLSRGIMTLEDELGVELFERRSTGFVSPRPDAL
ncbi:MAG: helix-turn-helix domain-containing protein [Methylocella sp.]